MMFLKLRKFVLLYLLWLCSIVWLAPAYAHNSPVNEGLPQPVAASYHLGEHYRLAGQFDSAMAYYNRGILQSRQGNKPVAEAIGKFYVSQLVQVRATPERTDSLAVAALAQMQQYGYYGHYYRKGLVVIGYNAMLAARYDIGMQIAQRTIKLAKANNDYTVEAQALDVMSVAYYGVNKTPKSDSLQQEAIAILRRNNNYALLADLLASNMVVYTDAQKTIDIGREVLYGIRPRQENLTAMSYASTFIGHAHGMLGREDSMIFYLKQAEAMNTIIQDPVNSIDIYGSYAFLYKQRGQWDSVIASANKFLQRYTPYVGIDQQREFRNILAEAYEAKGDYKNALINTQIAQQLNDSLDAVETHSKMEELDRKYKMASKDEQIRNLAYRSEASARQNLQLIAIISLLLVGAGLIFWLYIRKRKALKIIAAQRVKLSFLMKEIHHRVKNNLQVVSSLISLQQEALHDPAVEAAFENTQLRIGSMALLHKKLYQDDLDGLVDLDDYLEQLVAVAIDTHGYRLGVKTEVGKSGVLLGLDTASPIGMIVSELIINSCKYAVKEGQQLEIRVNTTRTDKHIVFQYWDNGPGLPEGWERNTQKSLGMRLIRMMIRQLKGKMTYSYEGGSSFRFEFPQ